MLSCKPLHHVLNVTWLTYPDQDDVTELISPCGGQVAGEDEGVGEDGKRVMVVAPPL